MSLKISKDLELPDDSVTKTFAIIAQRRKGKTYTANVMAEEMVAAKIPWVALDPTGAWWGLRSSANGKKAGLPVYVFGGDHGDLPLERTAGRMIADLVVEHPAWYILDFSHFESKEAERQLATDFAERFYRRKGSNKTPMHLFVDEADMFAPQRTPAGDQRMLGAFESIVRRGGIRGIGTTLITQRAAVLNKNVLEQIDVLIALRTVGPNDRKAIAGYVDAFATPEQQKELMGSIASLDLGEAYIWEPGADLFKRIHIRKRHTFNSSATPKAGDIQHDVVALAKVDLQKISKEMAATVEKAEADDPVKLRQQIAELKRSITSQKAQVEIKEVPVPVIMDKQLGELTITIRELQGYLKDFQDAIGSPDNYEPTTSGQQKTSPSPKVEADLDGAKVTAGALRILKVLGSRYPMHFTRAQLATLSKLSPRSGTYGTYLSMLRTKRFIESGEGDFIDITETGLNYVGNQLPVPETQEEILEMWSNNLTGGARRMFDVLIQVYPSVISREELGERTEMSAKSGTFGTYLSMLRRNSLVKVNGNLIGASDTLFIAGTTS